LSEIEKDALGSSRFVAFLDECGDHSMTSIDDDFPLFVLATVIVERRTYIEDILPRINSFKLSYWDHEGVNLHSRDIRKSEGPFSILQNPRRRERFLSGLSTLMERLPYWLLIVGINKRGHIERYAERARNPYELAMTFTFERIVHFLERVGEHHLPVVAETRGRKEDASLAEAFHQLLDEGTAYVLADRFQRLDCPLVFQSKQRNICGLQLADLCAHPCARHILKPEQANQAYSVVRRKLLPCGPVSAWKVFP